MMLRPKEKPPFQYLLARALVVLAVANAAIVAFMWIASFASGKAPSAGLVLAFTIMFVSLLVAVFLLMSILAFHFDYSALGRLQRAPFPAEKPLLQKTNSWGRVGTFYATRPFFGWYVFSSGLGLSIFGIGKVFLPNERITFVGKDRGSFFQSIRYRVEHKSLDANGPIYVPDQQVVEALRDVLAGKGSQTVATVTEVKAGSRKLAKINFFLIAAVLWGIPMMWFSLSTIYARLSIEVHGAIVSRQSTARTTTYILRQADGTLTWYVARPNDTELSRDMPVGARVEKEKWRQQYSVDGKEVADFPIWFYGVDGMIGASIFGLGLLFGLRRMRK